MHDDLVERDGGIQVRHHANGPARRVGGRGVVADRERLRRRALLLPAAEVARLGIRMEVLGLRRSAARAFGREQDVSTSERIPDEVGHERSYHYPVHYLDYAATAPVLPEVREAMLP